MKRSKYWRIMGILSLIAAVSHLISGKTNEALFFLTVCSVAISTTDVLEAIEASK